jgi:hypothetical protein
MCISGINMHHHQQMDHFLHMVVSYKDQDRTSPLMTHALYVSQASLLKRGGQFIVKDGAGRPHVRWIRLWAGSLNVRLGHVVCIVV